jgi:type IX secretion system PorP/SprF family membrane protein
MKRFFMGLFPLFVGVPVLAQDLQFSMPENAPLLLNPALAGANASLQVIANYRNQWNSIASPFSSIAASIDGRINESKNRGFLVAGACASSDRSGDLSMTSNTFHLNLGYQLRTGKERKLGFGIQATFGQRGIERSGATFPNQYNGMAYNPAIQGEQLTNAMFSYMSLGSGIVYTYEKAGGYMRQHLTKRFNLGLAAYHLNRPPYSYFMKGDEHLEIRYVLFFNSAFAIKHTEGTIMPMFCIQRQASTMSVLIGSNYRYSLVDGAQKTAFVRPMALHAGFFYRINDAFILRTQFEFKEFNIGLSYDITVSRLRIANKSFGGFELFFKYQLFGGFSNHHKLE